MKTPDFWHDKDKLWGKVLDPLGDFYNFGGNIVRRFAGKPYKSPVPVICVGNAIAGGTGKTPVAMALGKLLLGRGIKVHYLSRGYGGKEKGPLQVDPGRHTAKDVGDEPLLLSDLAPTWIARKRPAGCKAAVEAGAELIIMDDGFQNPSLIKDLSLLVIDGEYGFGNGRMIPAGPLREPALTALKRADAVIMIGKQTVDIPNFPIPNLPIIKAIIKADPEAEKLADVRVIGFAGIGRPAKFFKTLRATDCDLRDGYVFGDHYHYKKHNIKMLKDQAEKTDSPEDQAGVTVLNIALEWEKEKAILSLLKPLVPKRKR